VTLPVTASQSIKLVSLAGNLPAHVVSVTVSATQTEHVSSQSSIPDQQARGVARFTNLSQSDLIIPAGTIVYSQSPAAVRFTTLNDTHLPGNINAVVEVPIMAVGGGTQGNLPANAIQAIEGSLTLSAAVTNPRPTTGGTDRVTAAPSEADRQRLHDVLMGLLKSQARSQIGNSIGPNDWLLAESLTLVRVVAETYNPPAGKPGTVLGLTMQGEFTAQVIKADDMQQFVQATLDGSRPSGFVPVPGSASAVLADTPRVDDTGVHFNIRVSRKLVRDLDLARAGTLVRGRSPRAAALLLQSSLPLGAAPDIKLSPAWWPWMPLVPFRLTVVGSQ
jgi:hypothetical protein